MRKKLLAAGLLALVGVLAFLVLRQPPKIYSISIASYFSRPDRSSRVRINGTLVPSSLCRRHEPCELRFQLRDGTLDSAQTLSVRYASCLVPDMPNFGSVVRITVEGEACPTCPEFEAEQMFVMMPHKFEYKVDAGIPQLPAPPCDAR